MRRAAIVVRRFAAGLRLQVRERLLQCRVFRVHRTHRVEPAVQRPRRPLRQRAGQVRRGARAFQRESIDAGSVRPTATSRPSVSSAVVTRTSSRASLRRVVIEGVSRSTCDRARADRGRSASRTRRAGGHARRALQHAQRRGCLLLVGGPRRRVRTGHVEALHVRPDGGADARGRGRENRSLDGARHCGRQCPSRTRHTRTPRRRATSSPFLAPRWRTRGHAGCQSKDQAMLSARTSTAMTAHNAGVAGPRPPSGSSRTFKQSPRRRHR